MSDNDYQPNATPIELTGTRITDQANRGNVGRTNRATGKAVKRGKPAPEPMPGTPLTVEDRARLEAARARHAGTSPFGTTNRRMASQAATQARGKLPETFVPESGPVRSRIAEAARQRLTQADLSVRDGRARKQPKPAPYPPVDRTQPTVTAAPSRKRRIEAQRRNQADSTQRANRVNGRTPDVHGARQHPAGHTQSAWADLADGAERDFRPYIRE